MDSGQRKIYSLTLMLTFAIVLAGFFVGERTTVYADSYCYSPDIEIVINQASGGFSPNVVKAQTGACVDIIINNLDYPEIHSFMIDDVNLHVEIVGQYQRYDYIVQMPDISMNITFYCGEPDHRSKGEEGLLIIDELSGIVDDPVDQLPEQPGPSFSEKIDVRILMGALAVVATFSFYMLIVRE